MFKIEFTNKNGQPETEVFNNLITDDWIQGLPSVYKVPKENFIIYKFDVDLSDAHAFFRSSTKHSIDKDSTAGKVIVLRTDKSVHFEGQFERLLEYESKVAERIATFSDLTPVTVTALPTVQHDFGGGLEDAVELVAGSDMLSDVVQTAQEFVGTALVQWPYDNNGKFLGNN